MKIVFILVIMTMTASAYSDKEIRDMKYLKIEGRAAKQAATFYLEKFNTSNKSLIAKRSELESNEDKLKAMKRKSGCKSETCSHSRGKSCYKLKRSLDKQAVLISKLKEMVNNIEKEAKANKKFLDGKRKIYKDCVSQYLAIKDKK